MGDSLKILATDLLFPEGPVAMSDGSVLFVEIASGRLRRCYPDGRIEVAAEPGGGPNGAAIGPDGHCYVCNNGGFLWSNDPQRGLVAHGRAVDYSGGRIERIDLASGRVERLYERTASGPLSAPNDIVFDAHGGFWFTDLGSMAATAVERGRVCYAKADGSMIRETIFPMLTPNGIGLSPDGKTLYVAETLTARLWAFAVVAPGQLQRQSGSPPSQGRMLYAASEYCSFDSLAVEAGGNVCIATIGTQSVAGITVISPQGGLVERVLMPDRTATNICFGGADLQTAYVTLSHSGRLAALPWTRRGLALNHLNL